MFCTRCGNAEGDDAVYCSNCGAPIASPSPPANQAAESFGVTQMAATPAAPNPPHSGTRPAVNFGRLNRGDLVAGIASFLVLISLFFPWYSFAASPTQASATATLAQQQLVLAVCGQQLTVCTSSAAPKFSVSALGAGAGGWRFLILVVAIVVVLYVLSQALDTVAGAIPNHWQLLIGMTALQGLLVVIAFFVNPFGILDNLGSSSWAFGAFLAIIAAIAAVVGAVLVMQENKKAVGAPSS